MKKESKMKSWTVEEMLLRKPCQGYDRDRLLCLWNGKDRLTVWEILNLPIPAADRVWATLQDGPHVGVAIEKILTRCITNHVLHCGMPFVEKWAADWLSGADRTHVSARAVNASLSLSPDWAARKALRATESCAAVVAAYWAAHATSGVAAYAAERELQIADIRASV